MGSAERLEPIARGAGDHPLGVPVERVGSAVCRLGAGIKPIEERRSARTGDERAGRARQQLVQRQRPRSDVECRGRQGKKNVEAQLTERTRQRRQQIVR
jgi:hypothetical protein